MSSVLMSFSSLRMTLAMSGSFPGIGDDASYGRGRRHHGAAEVDEARGIAHAALEVAVGGAEGRLAVPQRALVDAQAGPAAGVHDHRAGLHEVVDVALVQGLGEDL